MGNGQNERRQMLEASYLRWHYKGRDGKGLTHQEIGDRLGLTVHQVQRILERALETGVVEIVVHEIDDDKLETDLLRAYPHLKKAIIVPSFEEERGLTERLA